MNLSRRSVLTAREEVTHFRETWEEEVGCGDVPKGPSSLLLSLSRRMDTDTQKDTNLAPRAFFKKFPTHIPEHLGCAKPELPSRGHHSFSHCGGRGLN